MTTGIPLALIEYGRQRSEEVVEKLRNAQRNIETEIDANDGLYPFNGGRISQAELCRRADVSPVTLSTDAHRETTRRMVIEWIERIQSKAITGQKSVRKAVTDRVEDWKRQHAAIRDNYRLAELELMEMRRKYQLLSEENAALKELLKKTAADKVLVLPVK